MAHVHRRCMLALLAAFPMACLACDAEEAQAAVDGIRRSLAEEQFERLYNDQTSEFFKAGMRRADFVQNMKQGRAQVGSLKSADAISYTFSEVDQRTGYRGKIYSFDFHVKYEKGGFYERLAVIKDPDGRFRLGSVWASPAPY